MVRNTWLDLGKLSIHKPKCPGYLFMRGATSTTILQHSYNKSWVVSYYWFKFEFSTEITFLTQQ